MTQPYAATCVLSQGTVSFIRSRAPSENVKVKTSSVNVNLVTGSRKTMPMMRGVSAALASCTATRSDEQMKTTVVNSEEARVASTVIAVPGSIVDSQLIPFSIQ